MPGPHFTPRTVPFLRALKRNNDREWFRERRAIYDEHVYAPMTAVIEQLAADFPSFAPELVADPKRSIYRIYRDTRFSPDKSPLKTHIAAVFPPRDGARHESAGLYFEVAHGWVWAGGGLYRPTPLSLHRVRDHIASNLTQFRALVTAPAFRRQCGELQGEQLTRVPRPFPAGHPAAEYPEDEAVPRRAGIPGGPRGQPPVLLEPARRLQGDCAGRPLPERRDARPGSLIPEVLR